MRFPHFYGNDGLKLRLSAARGNLSHCYILEGPAGSGKKTLSRIMAAAMECEASGNKPCLQCSACRKVMKNEHPDVITVDSDKATVPIKVIREMQADAYIKPNEGLRKIYIIPRAQDMQGPAQNALLKLLEEPPSYCAFFLLTDAGEKLLETVRSRAVSLTLSPLTETQLTTALREQSPEATSQEIARAIDRSEGYLGAAIETLRTPDTELEQKAQAFLTAFASGDELKLLLAVLPLEKRSRTELLELLALLQRRFAQAMDPGHPNPILSRCTTQQLFRAAGGISRAISLLQSNGSAGHAAGLLLAELR